MIAKLSGLLDSVGTDHCIVDCGGVGYLVFCSARTLRRVGDTGTAVSLRIEMQVREDAITLFGFVDQPERDWFRRLTTVQGVGSRVALALLSVLEPEKLGQAIAWPSFSGSRTDSSASATRDPTPWTVVSRRNQSRSG